MKEIPAQRKLVLSLEIEAVRDKLLRRDISAFTVRRDGDNVWIDEYPEVIRSRIGLKK